MTNQPKELQNKELLLRNIEKLDFFNIQENNKVASATTKPQPGSLLNVDFRKFNMNNPQNILDYINSPRYKALKASIIKDLIQLDSLKQEQQATARQQFLKLRIMLFMLLALYMDKAKAKTELNVRILEQLQDTFRKQKELHAKESLKNTPLEITSYESTIAPLVDKAAQLESRITLLDEKIADIEKKEADVSQNAIHLESILVELQALSHEELEVIKNDEIAQQNAQKEPAPPEKAQHVSLLDKMILEKKGEQKYLTADCKPTNSIIDAAFIIPADKTLHKDGGNYLLLNKDEPLNEASKLAGKNDFENQKVALRAPLPALRENTKESLNKLSVEKTACLKEKEQCTVELQQTQARLNQVAETFGISPIKLTPIPNSVKGDTPNKIMEASSTVETPKTTIEISPQKYQEALQQLEQMPIQGNLQNCISLLPQDKQPQTENALRGILNKNVPPNTPLKMTDAQTALDVLKKVGAPEKSAPLAQGQNSIK